MKTDAQLQQDVIAELSRLGVSTADRR